MQPLEASFTAGDGSEIFYRVWPAAGVARAALVLVHGMGEHSGRYRHVAHFLATRGVAVYALDLRGHGLSGGERGTARRFADFLDDVGAFHELARSENAQLPLVLLGHSMGGLIVTAYVLERLPAPDLLVLSGPAIVPLIDPGDRSIDPTRLSRDPEVWKSYLEDPLVLRERVQEGLFLALADGLALLVGRASEIAVPVLLIHGDADRLCSAEGAADYVRATASGDVTVRLYPQGRHEMFNEVNRDEVLADLWAWLRPRL